MRTRPSRRFDESLEQVQRAREPCRSSVGADWRAVTSTRAVRPLGRRPRVEHVAAGGAESLLEAYWGSRGAFATLPREDYRGVRPRTCAIGSRRDRRSTRGWSWRSRGRRRGWGTAVIDLVGRSQIWWSVIADAKSGGTPGKTVLLRPNRADTPGQRARAATRCPSRLRVSNLEAVRGVAPHARDQRPGDQRPGGQRQSGPRQRGWPPTARCSSCPLREPDRVRRRGRGRCHQLVPPTRRPQAIPRRLLPSDQGRLQRSLGPNARPPLRTQARQGPVSTTSLAQATDVLDCSLLLRPPLMPWSSSAARLAQPRADGRSLAPRGAP